MIQLTFLDITHNIELTRLDFHNNQFTSIDLSKNTNLTELVCHTNKLVTLDLSENTNLTTLDCKKNPLMTCIQVNEIQNSSIPAGWLKDLNVEYSVEPCL